MASDRARISFDPSRAYRAVVAQQGRVTLDADVNEAASIETEALRLETVDIIGPAGAPTMPPPGDGYLVIAGAGPGDTSIHEGVFYLGGWRLSLDQPVQLASQPDWRDQPPSDLGEGGDYVVSLLITEQSVCAVEDQALREVALGGPDTAARLRLMQQFLLSPADGETCADGDAAMARRLAVDGVSLDPASLQIVSKATLEVGFLSDGAAPDPCSPAAAGGYLGADNQLVRVTVSDFDAQVGGGHLLWGWNNASFLYRADLTDPAGGVFTLRGAPIDQEHAPQLGQAVEILRIRTDLKDDDYIAADAGFVTTIAQAYSFDDGALTITDPLPADYRSDPGPLFVRLWQAIVPFTAGQAAPLDSTSGLSVTVDLPILPSDPLVARPFWRFAVRPDTPTLVYPARYLEGPQPPDGPRQWLCDLGVIGPGVEGYALLADCRPKFTPLTDLNCDCCGLTLDTAGVAARGGLQAVVDSLAGSPAVLSLKPGEYVLPKPLTLTARHKSLTIEGCSAGVSIRPDPARPRGFGLGLFHLEKTSAVTLRRMDFDLTLQVTGKGGTVVGVLADGCGLTTIEDCTFGIGMRSDARLTRMLHTHAAQGGVILGGAIVLAGRSAEMTIRRNRFVGKSIIESAIICGVLAGSTARAVQTLLEEVQIEDNYFERLNAAVFAYARLGDIRCTDNRVRNCVVGFYFADTLQGVAGVFAKQALAEAQRSPALAQAVQEGLPTHWMAQAAQSDAPFLSRATASEPARASTLTHEAIIKDIEARGQSAYAEIAGHPAFAAAAPPETNENATGAGQANVLRAEYVADLDHVQAVALSASLAASSLATALHLCGNDIVLAAATGRLRGVGMATLFGAHDAAPMVVMHGNRVGCAGPLSLGAAVWFAGAAAVTGNMMMRPEGADAFKTGVFVSIGLQAGHYAYTGNVFHVGALITPARTSPAASPDWAFLNTVT
jgi:hypothetical protein